MRFIFNSRFEWRFIAIVDGGFEAYLRSLNVFSCKKSENKKVFMFFLLTFSFEKLYMITTFNLNIKTISFTKQKQKKTNNSDDVYTRRYTILALKLMIIHTMKRNDYKKLAHYVLLSNETNTTVTYFIGQCNIGCYTIS